MDPGEFFPESLVPICNGCWPKCTTCGLNKPEINSFYSCTSEMAKQSIVFGSLCVCTITEKTSDEKLM